MRLSTRLTVTMIALVALTATAVGLLINWDIERRELPRALDRIDTHANLLALQLEASVRGSRADVSTQGRGIEGLVSASVGGMHPRDGTSETEWRNRLASRFVAELTAKPAYAQFRLIGIADGGREIVRVDRMGPNGAIRVVPSNELQQKAARDYFKAAIQLPAGEVYVSPIDFNQEGGAPSTPHVPTLRVAAPVFAPDASPFGILIVNVDMRSAFAGIRSAGRDGAVYVVNERGDYLVHPDPKREFGFEFGRQFRVQDEFPEFANMLGRIDTPPRVIRDRAGAAFGVGFESIRLAGGPRVSVIESVPYSRIVAANTALPSLLGALVVVLLALPLVILLARSLTRPLAQITAAIEGFVHNGSIPVPTNASGEIAVLARAFNRMVADVQDKSAALKREFEAGSRILETSLDLILVTDRRGQFIRVSPSCETILGYKPEEMIGHIGTDFIHPDDLESTRNEMRLARRGRAVSNFESRYFHKDGRAVTLAWSGVWSEPEQLHYFIGRDTTAQKRLEEAERSLREMLAAVIDASPVAIICLAADRTVIVWSRAAEQIFGYKAEETVGKLYPLVPEGQEAEFDALVKRALAGETLRNIRVQRRRKDGSLVDISFDAAAMYDGKTIRGVAYALVDITERNQLEQQLRQALKLEAVGQLTGGVAHDFNNILTVIIGMTELMTDQVSDQPDLASIAKMIDEAAARGAALTQQLLAFARKQPLQPRETDINSLLIETVKLLRPTLSETVDIESMLEENIWPALVDPGQLSTALLNLALNARDAMPNGGKLTLETDNAVLDESYARVHSEVAPGAYVMIALSDTGSGIPAAVRDKVFEPFFTTKEVGKGTGLGLSMVYGFIKQSGGHISIYSEEGHGTTIKLYLPRAGEHANAPITPLTFFEGGRESILVVEDDPLVRNYVIAQLENLGYATLVAANATEALQIIDQRSDVDLLFTDVIMAGTMNGPQLAGEIVKRRPAIKVLYTSGYTENAIIHQGRLDPGVLLLPKPYRRADLARMIRMALG